MSPSFTRREALRSVSVVGSLGIAGCFSNGAESPSTPTEEPTKSPTTGTPTERPGEVLYRVSVADSGIKEDADPGNVEGLEFTVQVPDPEITRGETATVVLERENAGNERIEVGTDPESGAQPQYSSAVGEPTLGIVLVPTEQYDLESVEPGCWSPDTDGLTVLSHGGTMPLDPGKSVAVEYGVWAEPTEARECIRPGTYGFEELSVRWELSLSEPP